MPENTPQIFKNRSAVAKWLAENGYKVKKSKVYKDVDAGLLKMELDGTITIESVRRYIGHPEAGISEQIKTAETGQDREVREYHRKTASAKAEKIELEVQKLRREMEVEEGKWIPRENLELEMAGRAAVLDQGLRNLIQIRVDHWINLVNGDQARSGELRAAMFDELDALMNSYVSTDTFQVLFEED